MHFYIVTPCFNALSWLTRCVRSVADQVSPGVTVHHHVQDGRSSDGTREWLEQWQREHKGQPGYRFSYESAPDGGMYDAINRAWEALPPEADVTAHLNADEQYLPGALAAVAERMEKRPAADIAVGSYLVLDKHYRYICHRRTSLLSATFSRVICQIITCACFHRTEAFRRRRVRFDTSYRSLADLIFYRDTLAAGARVMHMPGLITSAFVVTGGNLSWSVVTEQERERLFAEQPPWLRRLAPLLLKLNNAQYLICDCFCEKPKRYEVYCGEDRTRSLFAIRRPTVRWGMRTEGERDA